MTEAYRKGYSDAAKGLHRNPYRNTDAQAASDYERGQMAWQVD